MSFRSPLESVHEEHGAVFGGPAPRHYGDPAAEYGAAREAAVVVDRSDRSFVRVYGRDPVRMVQGLVTNDVAGAAAGQGVYAALLTVKGRMVADLRVYRRDGGELLLDCDAAAQPGLLEHLRRFVPPLFARFEDSTPSLGMLGVYGPAAAATVGRGLGVEAPVGGPEDAYVVAAFAGADLLVVRTAYAGVDGYDVIASAAVLEAAWRALAGAGARPAGHGTLEVLRIEAGRPRWGAELDEKVIPLEAGLRERAISETKGCYTGQEVIIRILHRGHVNRHLRGLLLGEAPAPAHGTPLLRPEDGKPMGLVTSSCASPRHGQTIGLGYVRREIEPPSELRLDGVEGARVQVIALPFAERAGAGRS